MTLALSCFEEDMPPVVSDTSESASGTGTTGMGTMTATEPGTTTAETDPSGTTGPTSGVTTDATDSLDSSTTEEPPPIQCGDGIPAPGELCLGETTTLMANEPIFAARIGDVSGSPAADVVYLIADQVVVRVGDGVESFGPEVFSASVTADHFELADFDADGELDLAAVGSGEMLRLLLGSGAGSFVPSSAVAVGGSGRTLAVGDLDGDDNLDIVVGTDGIGMLFPVLGLGNGELNSLMSVPSFGAVQAIVMADLTGSTATDVAFTIEGGAMEGVALRPGEGGGLLQDQQTTPGMMPAPRDLVAGDFDGDGVVDLAYVSSTLNTLGVLLGDGDGGFGAEQTYPVGLEPSALAAADFTNDGRDDLVVGQISEVGLRIFVAEPDGTMLEGEAPELSEPIADLATGDVNDDGVPDIAATSDDSPVVLVVISTP